MVYRNIEDNPLDDKWANIRAYTAYLADRYDFFHWHIAFPEVFAVRDNAGELTTPDDETPTIPEITGWNGGFDVVLGNPPWEKIRIEEKQWFAERVPEIANASRASKRKKMIKALQVQRPLIYSEWIEDLRKAAGETYLIRNSSHYPLCGRGDVNTYTIFAEISRHLVDERGQVGIIVPSGVATDSTTQYFFRDLIENQSLASLYSFENEEFIFPEIHHATKFCLLTISGLSRDQVIADFMFFARQTSHLQDEERHFTLTSEEFAAINPNTRTCPIFRNKHDAELNKEVYKRTPVLLQEDGDNLWNVSFMAMFHMSGDSGLYVDDSNDGYVPLYEAKLIHQFNHRYSTYDGATQANLNAGILPNATTEDLADPKYEALPRYWLDAKNVTERLAERWEKGWLLAYRRITSSVVFRTMIITPIPLFATADPAMVLLPSLEENSKISSLLANLNSFMLDYTARQKIGGTDLRNHFFQQFPVIPPHTYTQELIDFIMSRVLELTYTAWDLQAFAQDVGYDGAPFIWDEERRFWLRAELDALYFHLYGIGREDVDYIMETFPIVKRKDIKATSAGETYGLQPPPANPNNPATSPPLPVRDERSGEGLGVRAEGGFYRTKTAILAIYDEMANLPTMDVPAPKGDGTITIPDVSQYQPALSPPPASPSAAHEDTRE